MSIILHTTDGEIELTQYYADDSGDFPHTMAFLYKGNQKVNQMVADKVEEERKRIFNEYSDGFLERKGYKSYSDIPLYDAFNLIEFTFSNNGKGLESCRLWRMATDVLDPVDDNDFADMEIDIPLTVTSNTDEIKQIITTAALCQLLGERKGNLCAIA